MEHMYSDGGREAGGGGGRGAGGGQFYQSKALKSAAYRWRRGAEGVRLASASERS